MLGAARLGEEFWPLAVMAATAMDRAKVLSQVTKLAATFGTRVYVKKKKYATLAALAAHQCTHQGRVTVEGVHVTHVLKLLGDRQLWVCEGCGGQLSLKTKNVSQKLSVACSFKKDPRCKAQFKPEPTNAIRSLFQQVQGTAQVAADPPCAKSLRAPAAEAT